MHFELHVLTLQSCLLLRCLLSPHALDYLPHVLLCGVLDVRSWHSKRSLHSLSHDWCCVRSICSHGFWVRCIRYYSKVFCTAYLRDSVTYPFPTGFTLMWDWGGANGFDVVTSSTQNMHSQYAFN